MAAEVVVAVIAVLAASLADHCAVGAAVAIVADSVYTVAADIAVVAPAVVTHAAFAESAVGAQITRTVGTLFGATLTDLRTL